MRKLLIAVVSLALVAVAVIIAVILVKSAPQAERKERQKMAPLVITQVLTPADETVILKLNGSVMPAESIKLQARVSGEIIRMAPDFIEGGQIAKGEQILTIDAIDYELALANAESNLETARFSYKEELGRQEVAKREWELLKPEQATELEQELALRKPHLTAKKAALKSAEASVKKAKVNLERTGISAPFNALVLSRSVNIGSQATPQAELARLAGTDTAWVIVSIPVDRLGWVTIPGSDVTVHSTSGAKRVGKVIRLLGNLEDKGRMARLLVEIKDPLCLQEENKDKKPLLFGEYVRAEINGRTLQGVYTIPRSALREDETVWLATRDRKLDIHPAEVLWRDAAKVIISDTIEKESLLITSDINIPMNGMDVNTGNGKAGKNATKDKQPGAEDRS